MPCDTSLHMKLPTHYVTFVRAAGSYTADKQRDEINAWLKQHGGKVETEYDAAELPGAVDEWATRTAKTEGAIVAALWLLPEGKASGTRPVVQMTRILGEVSRRAMLVVEASTGMTSRHAKWPERCAEAVDYLSRGKRKLSTAQAKAMAKRALEKSPPGAVERWHDRANASRLKALRTHWLSREFSSGVEAYNALPDDIRRDVGSIRMLYKICGPRGGHGGRPPKVKRKGK